MINDNPIGYAILNHNQKSGKNIPFVDIPAYVFQMIFIIKEYRTKGIGLKVYQFLLDNGIILQADSMQTITAQNIWNKLETSNLYDVQDISGIKIAKRKD